MPPKTFEEHVIEDKSDHQIEAGLELCYYDVLSPQEQEQVIKEAERRGISR